MTTHFVDQQLPTTSSSSQEHRKQQSTNLSTACKKVTRTKKTKTSKKRKLSNDSCYHNKNVQEQQSYDDLDTEVNKIKSFSPSRNPGPHINKHFLRRKNTALDFFSLFFDQQLIEKIVSHTNEYAHITIMNKSTYADKHGAWVETTPAEIRNLIAILIYQGLVRVSSFKNYWSTKSLYHGLWARTMMSRNRYSALISMIHVVDPAKEDKTNKLRKISEFSDIIKEKCESLYQPHQNVAIDE